jgi:hypothetical protein
MASRSLPISHRSFQMTDNHQVLCDAMTPNFRSNGQAANACAVVPNLALARRSPRRQNA